MLHPHSCNDVIHAFAPRPGPRRSCCSDFWCPRCDKVTYGASHCCIDCSAMKRLHACVCSVARVRVLGHPDKICFRYLLNHVFLPFAQGLSTTAGLLSLSSLLNLGSLGGSTPGGSWLAASAPLGAPSTAAAAAAAAGAAQRPGRPPRPRGGPQAGGAAAARQRPRIGGRRRGRGGPGRRGPADPGLKPSAPWARP